MTAGAASLNGTGQANRALELFARGLDPVLCAEGEKTPIGNGWQDIRYASEGEVAEAFAGPCNIGILLGDNVVDIDLDHAFARRLAPHFLPPTELKHGRPNSPGSHRWYRIDGATPTKKYQFDKLMLLELRANRTDGGRGLQTIISGRHPSGEYYQMEADGDPAEVTNAELNKQCADLAAATLLRMCWSKVQGERHDAALAIGGMFARGGLDQSRAEKIIEHALRHDGVDEEWGDRKRAVADSYRAVAKGDRATGTPTVARMFGDEAVRCLRDWLGLAQVTDQEAEEEESKPRFRILTDSEIESREPPEMLVDDIMPAGGLGLLYGLPGALKSFWMVAIALHIQTGRQYLGRRVRQGNILYTIGEGVSQFGRRPAAFKAWNGIEGDTGASWLTDTPVQLADPADTRAYLRTIESAGLGELSLVVMDTLARSAVGVEENSATDMGKLIAGCDLIRRETGAAVWLIHHSNKLGQRERGSSALTGAMDTIIKASVDGDVVTLKAEKQKDLGPFDDLLFRKKVVEFDTGATSLVLDPVSRDEVTAKPPSPDKLDGNRRIAFDALTEHFDSETGATASEWRAVSTLAERSFFSAIKPLKLWGFVRFQNRRYFPIGA